MKVALDTNVLAYAEGINDAAKRDSAIELIRNLPPGSGVIPAQVLGELFNVLVRKAGRSRSEARNAILGWRDSFEIAASTPEVVLNAADLANDHAFGIWDAVIMACASHAGCRLLLSEDLQDGFTWGGVTVANPFAPSRNPLLQELLRDNPRE